MTTYFAVCNVGGPISIEIQADSVEAAVGLFDDIDQRSVIDDGRCDVSRLLDWKESDTRGKTDDEIAEMLQAAGCKEICDLDSVYNYHGRTSGHLQNGWTLWEAVILKSDMPPSAKQTFSVQWEFMGPATQEHFEAAQAVADAMEILGTIEATEDVLAKACQKLNMDGGWGWDSKSVLAMIENCSFERIDSNAPSGE